VVEIVIDAAAGRLPVIVGLGNESDESADLGSFAVREGAAAVMLAAPAGHSQSEASEWLIRTALELEARVVVQEAPVYLGNAIGPDGLREIVNQCDNVRDIKVEGGPGALWVAMAALDSEATFWSGDGGLYALDCLRAGAAGFMPGVEIVDLLVEVYRAEREDDGPHAEATLGRALGLLTFEMQSLATYVASAKSALAQRGLLCSAASRVEPRGLPERLAELLRAHLQIALGERPAS
jgi:4-hydroxy-tetrahydrodipicolinate synthase